VKHLQLLKCFGLAYFFTSKARAYPNALTLLLSIARLLVSHTLADFTEEAPCSGVLRKLHLQTDGTTLSITTLSITVLSVGSLSIKFAAFSINNNQRNIA
jgi:hypothetical protein